MAAGHTWPIGANTFGKQKFRARKAIRNVAMALRVATPLPMGGGKGVG